MTVHLVNNLLPGKVTTNKLSTADVNPIGGISKTDLKKFIAYAQQGFDLPILAGYAIVVLSLVDKSLTCFTAS